MNEKIRSFLKQNFGYFIITLVSLIYIATAIITIDETGKTLAQIIADSIIIFFLGVLINRIFDLQGMLNGDRDETVIKTLALHAQMVIKISPHIDKLDDWCRLKNQENLRLQRTKILSLEGLKYNDYFEDNGSLIKEYVIDKEKLNNKYEKRQELAKYNCFKKALKLKLTQLTTNALISEGGKGNDPYYLGRTKAQYERQTSLSDIFTKIGLAFVFGYYGVRLIQDFNYANLIWNAFQVCIFLVMGTIKMYQAFFFVKDEFRGRIVKKINNLEMFYNYITSQEPEKKEVESPAVEEKPKEEIKEDTNKPEEVIPEQKLIEFTEVKNNE